MNEETLAAIAREESMWHWWRGFAADHVAALAEMWHSGDGDGGALLEAMRREVEQFNPYVVRRSDPRPTGYRKKPISAALRIAVFERDAYRCRHCGTWEQLTADHVIPESKGGPATMENLQTLCRPCNSSKGVKVE